MPLQSSGSISLNDIAGEFGGSTPHSINEYYGVAAGVPTSGQISFNQFYGTSACSETQPDLTNHTKVNQSYNFYDGVLTVFTFGEWLIVAPEDTTAVYATRDGGSTFSTISHPISSGYWSCIDRAWAWKHDGTAAMCAYQSGSVLFLKDNGSSVPTAHDCSSNPTYTNGMCYDSTNDRFIVQTGLAGFAWIPSSQLSTSSSQSWTQVGTNTNYTSNLQIRPMSGGQGVIHQSGSSAYKYRDYSNNNGTYNSHWIWWGWQYRSCPNTNYGFANKNANIQAIVDVKAYSGQTVTDIGPSGAISPNSLGFVGGYWVCPGRYQYTGTDISGRRGRIWYKKSTTTPSSANDWSFVSGEGYNQCTGWPSSPHSNCNYDNFPGESSSGQFTMGLSNGEWVAFARDWGSNYHRIVKMPYC